MERPPSASNVLGDLVFSEMWNYAKKANTAPTEKEACLEFEARVGILRRALTAVASTSTYPKDDMNIVLMERDVLGRYMKAHIAREYSKRV